MSTQEIPIVYVNDLSPETDECDIIEFMNEVGPVKYAKINREKGKGNSLGFGYVVFENIQDVEKAISTLNGKMLNDKPCSINRMLNDVERKNLTNQGGKSNIFIKDLPIDCNSKALLDVFRLYGAILSHKILYDKKKNQSKGMAIILYENPQSASNAIKELNKNTSKFGKEITVEYYKVNPSDEFTNIYIGNIGKNVTKEQIEENFARFGEISSLVVSAETKYGARYALLNFADSSSAKKAISEMNDDSTLGNPLKVCKHQNKKERHQNLKKQNENRYYLNSSIYVRSSNDEIKSEDDLKARFSQFGIIESSKLNKSEDKTYGYVTFKEIQSAMTAINYYQASKDISVAKYIPKEMREVTRPSFGFPYPIPLMAEQYPPPPMMYNQYSMPRVPFRSPFYNQFNHRNNSYYPRNPGYVQQSYKNQGSKTQENFMNEKKELIGTEIYNFIEKNYPDYSKIVDKLTGIILGSLALDRLEEFIKSDKLPELVDSAYQTHSNRH